MTASDAPLVAVVDDDSGVLEAIGNLLVSARYSVASFDSAESFLEDIVVREFDCLITDIGLPGLNGISLQTEIGLVLPELPVILITGRNEYGESGRVAFNNRGLFRKPFDAEELLAAVLSAVSATKR
jgi:FixJ family two-component response regulator